MSRIVKKNRTLVKRFYALFPSLFSWMPASVCLQGKQKGERQSPFPLHLLVDKKN